MPRIYCASAAACVNPLFNQIPRQCVSSVRWPLAKKRTTEYTEELLLFPFVNMHCISIYLFNNFG